MGLFAPPRGLGTNEQTRWYARRAITWALVSLAVSATVLVREIVLGI